MSRSPDSPDFLILTSLCLRTFSQSHTGVVILLQTKTQPQFERTVERLSNRFPVAFVVPIHRLAHGFMPFVAVRSAEGRKHHGPLSFTSCWLFQRSCHFYRLKLPYFSALPHANQLRKRPRTQPEQIVQAIRYRDLLFLSPDVSILLGTWAVFGVSIPQAVGSCFSDHVRCRRSPRDHRLAMIKVLLSRYPDCPILGSSPCLRISV
jgi:hypothetical protein